MRVCVQSNANFRMPHHVLQHFRIHTLSGHIRAVCMAADMRRNQRQLVFVRFVIALPDPLKNMLPMQRDSRPSIVIQTQKAAYAIYNGFLHRNLSCQDHFLQTALHIRAKGHHPDAAVCFGLEDIALHIPSPEQLLVHAQKVFLQVDIVDRQPSKFRYLPSFLWLSPFRRPCRACVLFIIPCVSLRFYIWSSKVCGAEQQTTYANTVYSILLHAFSAYD